MRIATEALFAVLAALAVRCDGGVQTCNVSAPDFQLCVRTALQHLVPQLATGVPSIGVEGVEPLQGLPPIVHSSPSLKMQIDDISVSGISSSNINDINVDLSSNTIRMQITVPGHVTVSGVHSTDADVMGIPLKGSGPFTVSIASPSLSVTLSGSPTVGPDGQAYLQLRHAAVGMQYGATSADVKGYFTQFPPLAAAASAFASAVATPLMQELRPSLEQWLAAVVLQRAQAVFSSLPYDALFPGRTPAALGLYRALSAHRK